METEETNTSTKVRGVRSCVADALKTVTKNFVQISKARWKPFLILSVTFAILKTWGDGLQAGVLFVGYELKTTQSIVSFLLSVIAGLMFWAVVLSIINNRSYKWNMLRLLKILPSNLSMMAASLFVGIAASTAYVMALGTAQTPIALVIAAGLPAFFIMSLLLYVPMTYVSCRYMIEPSLSLRKSFWKTFGEGFRGWGFMFLTILALFFCISLITLTLGLPSITMWAITMMSQWGVAAYGDPTGLPEYYVAIDFVANLYFYLLFIYMSIFSTKALCHATQTVTYKNKIRKELKAKAKAAKTEELQAQK